MNSYTITSELDQGRWDAFVEAAPQATTYHRYIWKQVIEDSFGHRTHYLAALDGAGEVAGVLPLVHMRSRLFGNFLVSVPFVNYGGLLCAAKPAEQALLEAAEEVRRNCGARHVELRHLGFCVAGLPSREHKVTMLLPLSADAQTQWVGFNAKLRNQVRKAEKNGLACSFGGPELLDDFYNVFARNMRDLGTPVYGKAFFENVLRGLAESTRVVAVALEGKTVAAGILSWYRHTMEMPWASSIGDYKQLCPNNLLYWEAIRFAIGRGCSAFDFGRSTPDEGTYNFKKQWGAEPVQLYWQYLLEAGQGLPELNPKNPKFGAAIRIWRKLPVGLTRLLGPGIVRNIP
jgi:FemAB-related protein (PEP-CTERM system-associated)